MRRVLTVLATAALAFGAAGCAGDKPRQPVVPPTTVGPTSPVPTPVPADPTTPDPTTPTVDPTTPEPITPAVGEISEADWANVEEWARTYANDDWATLETWTAPSTPAMGYVYYTGTYANVVAGQEAGWQFVPITFIASDRAARTLTFQNQDEAAEQWQITNIEVDATGLVASFDHGRPIADIITIGPALPPEDGAVHALLHSAYDTSSGLTVIYAVANYTGEPITLTEQPSYVSADGTALPTASWVSYDSFDPGEVLYNITVLDGADFGGNLEVTLGRADGSTEVFSIPVLPMQ